MEESCAKRTGKITRDERNQLTVLQTIEQESDCRENESIYIHAASLSEAMENAPDEATRQSIECMMRDMR